MIYIIAPNMIYRMNADGVCELCAYHPYSDVYGEGDIAAVLGGQVAVYSMDGLCLRTCDPAQLPAETLSIANFYGSDVHKRAAAQMQDVAIFFTRDGYFSSAQELGQALASGENQLDIIGVDLSWIDFARLMEKGYCYDLSGNKTLTDYAADIYPFMSEAVQTDGRLYGIPVQMYGDFWRYNKDAFQALGLTPPTTYAELVELINVFASEEHEDWWEEYTVLSDAEQYRMTLFYKAMRDYEQYMLVGGQPLNLDTPMFREVMDAVESVDAENIEIDPETAWNESGEPSEEMEALWNKTALIETWGSLEIEKVDGEYLRRYDTLKLRLTEGADFVIPAYVTVLFVNPRSEHLDTAVRYLENLVKNMDQGTMTRFSPNHNDPIENKYYESNLKDMEAYIARLEKQVETADPIDKQELQAGLDDYRAYMEEYKEKWRYQANEEDIARFRELMQYVVLEKPSVMYSQSNDDSFYTLRTRYAEGQITLEQFISEGGSKLRLMQMENR